MKTITAGEEGEEPKDKDKTDEDHMSKLARQQQEIIRQQEQLLQKQEKHIEDQERRIRLMELAQQKLTQQAQAQQSGNGQKASTSSGRGTTDKILNPSPFRFLPCVKKEKEEGEEEDDEVVIQA